MEFVESEPECTDVKQKPWDEWNIPNLMMGGGGGGRRGEEGWEGEVKERVNFVKVSEPQRVVF